MNKKLILIAEDDPDDRLMINEAFMENNVPVVIMFFNNGSEFLDYLEKEKLKESKTLPKLVLLDLNMPKLDGKTILKQLRENEDYQSIPVVILTTLRSKEDEAEVLDLGASEFYSKPSSFTELVGITKRICAKWLIN